MGQKKRVFKLRKPLWEIQEFETLINYELFKYYLNLGVTRSYRDVAYYYKKNTDKNTLSLISNMANKWHWKLRIASFLNHQDSQYYKAIAKNRKKQRDNALIRCNKLEEYLLHPFEVFIKKLNAGDIVYNSDSGFLWHNVISGIINRFIQLQEIRLKLNGEPTEIIEQKVKDIKKIQVEIIPPKLLNDTKI